jgi:phage shock protein C
MKKMFDRLKGRKLYRSPRDAVALGVCAGIASYLAVDPVFVRLLTIAIAIATTVWPVTIAYVIAYFLMPIDPAQDTVPRSQQPKDVTGKHESKKAGEAEPVERMDSSQSV